VLVSAFSALVTQGADAGGEAGARSVEAGVCVRDWRKGGHVVRTQTSKARG